VFSFGTAAIVQDLTLVGIDPGEHTSRCTAGTATAKQSNQVHAVLPHFDISLPIRCFQKASHLFLKIKGTLADEVRLNLIFLGTFDPAGSVCCVAPTFIPYKISFFWIFLASPKCTLFACRPFAHFSGAAQHLYRQSSHNKLG
jgi:hypothetical protein